jgi:hypothetical protein
MSESLRRDKRSLRSTRRKGGGGKESAGRIRSAPERANETRKCTKEVALLYQMSKEGAVSDMPSLEKQGGTERA